ncbi:hypothetical protein ACEQ8H_003127 [Pleosporales sp. CAS-2024a]
MAGRILPIALATVAGVSIGVATFGQEFKDQRRKRLQEEYDRYPLYRTVTGLSYTYTADSEVAAQAALAGQSVAPKASQPILSPLSSKTHTGQDIGKEEMQTTSTSAPSWSSILGLWAWKKRATQDATPEVAPSASTQRTAAGTSSKT